MQALTGSSEALGRVRLAPLLLQKGATKVALYGLGNIRDERLARMFQTPKCIEWCTLTSSPITRETTVTSRFSIKVLQPVTLK